MSRRGLIIIGIVAVLLLAAPYVIGMLHESAVRNGIERFSAQPTMQANVTSYERGWLGSQARMEFGIDPAYLSDLAEAAGDPVVMALGDFILPVIADFEHGPLLRSNGLGFGTSAIHAYIDPDSEPAQLAALLGMPYLIEFRGRGNLGLGFDYEGDIPPAEFAMPEASFEFSGIDFSGSFSRSGKTFDGELGLLAVQSMFFSAILESLSVRTDTRRSGPGEIPFGDSALSIARLAISDPFAGAASTFSADNISVTSSVTENSDDAFVDVGVVYAVDAMTMGADLAVDSAQIGINFEHLDAEAVREFYGQVDTSDLAGEPELLLAELSPLLEKLLAGAPVMSLDPLGFSMPQGEIAGRATVSLDPAAIPPGGVLDEVAMANAMASARVSLDLTASKELVSHLAQMYIGSQGQVEVPPEQAAASAQMQTDLMLLMLNTQGLIIDEGDTWTTSISLENGIPTANGQPLMLGF